MKRVLIIDDETAIAEILRDVLEEEGFTVATAFNGAQGLERMAEAKPDLVLLDMMMPLIDGRGVLDAIRRSAEWKSLPVVIMSAGRIDDEARRQAVGVFPKPFELDDLIDTVRRVVAGAKA